MTVNFEKTLEKLDKIVEKMESGKLPLEESLKIFEEGIALTRICHKALAEAEQKVQILLETEGHEKLSPFIAEDV